MAAAKNPMGCSRKMDDPYIILRDERFPGWTWKVLKTWQADGRKPYARAFVHVVTPHTGASGDLGDAYVTELGRTIVAFDPAVFPTMTDAARALFGEGAAFGVPVYPGLLVS